MRTHGPRTHSHSKQKKKSCSLPTLRHIHTHTPNTLLFSIKPQLPPFILFGQKSKHTPTYSRFEGGDQVQLIF
ncbi:hypothetical protein Hanom_Chr13g01233461 [Helianthus anomalus]